MVILKIDLYYKLFTNNFISDLWVPLVFRDGWAYLFKCRYLEYAKALPKLFTSVTGCFLYYNCGYCSSCRGCFSRFSRHVSRCCFSCYDFLHSCTRPTTSLILKSFVSRFDRRSVRCTSTLFDVHTRLSTKERSLRAWWWRRDDPNAIHDDVPWSAALEPVPDCDLFIAVRFRAAKWNKKNHTNKY